MSTRITHTMVCDCCKKEYDFQVDPANNMPQDWHGWMKVEVRTGGGKDKVKRDVCSLECLIQTLKDRFE